MRNPAVVTVFVLFAGLARGQEIPLTNWTVPPYRADSSSGGITTMTDVTHPRAFIGIQPCRVADTRGNGAPITGGIFPNSGLRNWDVTGICGIPAGADAISVNFSVVSTAATPQGAFLLAWPTGSPPAPGTITAVMTFGPGVTILSNAAIVPLGPGESLTVNVSHSTHVIMDVNGYFSDTLGNPSNTFELVTDSTTPTIVALNNSTSCVGTCGIAATTVSGTAILGHAVQNTGISLGGVYGVRGFSTADSSLSAGVRGDGFYQGVQGVTDGPLDAAGVIGQASFRPTIAFALDQAGVRGETSLTFGIGVIGLSKRAGVNGVLLSGLGGDIASGYLATTFGDDPDINPDPPWAVFGQGNIGATGTKYFLDPHPTDPQKVIGYIALEGAEAGTYFRGRAKFQRGLATIAVPEDFRLVTDADGLTVQVTPIGEMASFAVVKMGLDEIVVKASRDVEFSYLVQGVRTTWARHPPIFEDGVFIPQRSEAHMPRWLTPEQQRRLVQNGTYRPDGRVNMETARRIGWDKKWEKRSPPQSEDAER